MKDGIFTTEYEASHEWDRRMVYSRALVAGATVAAELAAKDDDPPAQEQVKLFIRRFANTVLDHYDTKFPEPIVVNGQGGSQ